MDNWNPQIEELETFFKDFVLPESIVMKPYANVINPAKMVCSHLSYVNHYNGKPTFLPYLHRLQAFMAYFKNHSDAYPEIVINPLNNHL